MQSWFVKNIGDAMMAVDSLEQIKWRVSQFCENADIPKNMAAFFRHETMNQLHCQVKVYFSPVLSELAVSLDADPCKKPDFKDLSDLFLGDE